MVCASGLREAFVSAIEEVGGHWFLFKSSAFTVAVWLVLILNKLCFFFRSRSFTN